MSVNMFGIDTLGSGNSRKSPATGPCCADTATWSRVTWERNDSGKNCRYNSQGTQETVWQCHQAVRDALQISWT